MGRKRWGSAKLKWGDEGRWGENASDTPSVELAGSIANGSNESAIVAGGQTLLLILLNTEWVATVGADNGITDALILGIDSAQSEAAGWDVQVKGNMVFGDIVRTSATMITITFAIEAAYAISADEIITVTVPATAVTHTAEIVATPTFRIINEA